MEDERQLRPRAPIVLKFAFVLFPFLLLPLLIFSRSQEPVTPNAVRTLAPPPPLAVGSAKRVVAAPAPTDTPAAVPVDVPTIPAPTDTPIPTRVASATPTLPITVAPLEYAYLRQRDGDYQTAIAGYQAVLAGQSAADDKLQAQFLIGQAYHMAGNESAAVGALEQFVQSHADAPQADQARFLLGVAHQAQGDRLTGDADEAPPDAVAEYNAAMQAYQAYRDRQGLVADYADFRIAQILTSLKRPDEALAVYGRIIDNPGAVASMKLEAWRWTARTYRSQGSFAKAANAYQQAIPFAAGDDQRAEFTYATGRALRDAGQVEAARVWWRQVVTRYPTSDQGVLALNDLIEWGDTGLSSYDRGMAYFHNDDFQGAVEALSRALDGSTSASSALYYLARSYMGLGQYDDAIQQLDTFIQKYPDDRLTDDAWFGKASAQYKKGAYADAVATFQAFADARPEDPRVPEALFRAAWAMEDTADCETASNAYIAMAGRFPKSEYADRSLFQAGMCDYKAGHVSDALILWNRVAATANDKNYGARAAFLAGKAEIQYGEAGRGQDYLERAAQVSPFSYFGLRAAALLGKAPAALPLPDPSPVAAEKWLAGWTRSTVEQVATAARAFDGRALYRQARELMVLGLQTEATDELRILRSQVWSDPIGLYWFARRAEELGAYKLGSAAAEHLIALSPSASNYQVPAFILSLAYPRAFAELVEPEAQRNGLDPLLFYALMRQESRYDPRATSSASARGLTQVMPATGRAIAQELGVADFAVPDLYKPHVSVRFGTYYLAAMLRQFGSTELALAAYNGGPGNARRWSRVSRDLDVVVESIDLQETSNYVRVVDEQYAVYRALYGNGE